MLALDRGRAPLTTANFLKYVDAKRFDGETFYRAMHYGSGGLIQGGIRSDARKLFPPIAHEPTSQTGLKQSPGRSSMARCGPGTRAGRLLHPDRRHPGVRRAAAASHGFAAFGQVVEGMDVVKAILAAPVSPTKGEGAMKGQMLDPPVKIVKAARLPD